MQTSKIASSVMAKCTCGSDIVRAGLKALLSLVVDTIQNFIFNLVTKRNADRKHLRKRSPQMLGQLDKAIQSESSLRAGMFQINLFYLNSFFQWPFIFFAPPEFRLQIGEEERAARRAALRSHISFIT